MPTMELGIIPSWTFDASTFPNGYETSSGGGGALQGLGDITDIPLVGEAVGFIQGKAQAGAESAIPDIKAAIQPYVIASLLLGLGGFVMGLAAYLSVQKLRKA